MYSSELILIVRTSLMGLWIFLKKISVCASFGWTYKNERIFLIFNWYTPNPIKQ